MIQLTSKQQIKQLFALAIPVSIGQAGNIIANMTDSAMLGKYDALHMLASTLGFEVFIIPFVLFIGITIGMTTIIAKDDGEGKTSNILGSSFVTHFIISAVIAALVYSSIYILHPDPRVVALSKPYVVLMAISIFPIGIFLTMKQFYEGYGLTMAATASSILANLANIGLNYIFIFGHFGCEPMGIVGAGYATLISRGISILFFILFIYLFKKYKEKITLQEFKVYKRKCIQIVKIGMPIGFQMFIEVTAFTCAGIFIGWIGNAELGAHTIALQYAGLTYLMVTGIGTAATVLAGNYLGEKNRELLHMLIKNVLIIAIFYEVITALIFLLFNNQMPHLFLADKETEMIGLAIILLRFAAVFQIPDGIQSTLQGVLRGVQDVKFPMWISIGVHYAITLSCGYVLAFYFHFGIYGMWMGFVLGLSTLALLLYMRLKYVLKKLDSIYFVTQ
jgi:multidrug resistance protein, MATE family